MDHIQLTIGTLQEKLRAYEEQVAHTKRLINDLCRESGREAVYADADMAQTSAQSINADTFYGQPLAPSIRRILEMRKSTGAGPATVKDIYTVLRDGGFIFNTKNEKNAMDGLRITLGKMSHTFHRLPNGEYGLLEWYPAVKDKKQKSGAASGGEKDEADESTEGGDS